LLFSVPLAAIPLMAIFGIPQFAPLVASPERSDGYRRHADDQSADRRLRDRRREDEFEDEFADQDAPEFETERQPPLDRNQNDRYARASDAAEQSSETLIESWPQDRPGDEGRTDAPPASPLSEDRLERRSPSRAAAPAVPSGSASQPAVSSLTWTSAAQRFQELGITSYHLEPGADPASFLFVCSFCPAGNANVTMRFESESGDPLAAVDDVLAQIDRWQQQTTPQP